MELTSSARWDAAADDYQKVFLQGQNSYNKAIFQYWEQNDMLRPGFRVLDIGCGVGKYGVLFAERACDVTLVDFSPEMLRHAAENMAQFSAPWRTYCCDFTKVRGDEPIFAEGFDFSISTMSPAVCDVETVRKMSAITRGSCFLSRFRSWEQPLRNEVLRRAGEEPHGYFDDPEGECESMIRAVREAGFEPQVKTVDYNWSDLRSPEEMARVLQHGSRTLHCGTEALIRAARSLSDVGVVNDAVYTTVAWISWRTSV